MKAPFIIPFIALIDRIFNTQQDHYGTISAESPIHVDHVFRQTLQETLDQKERTTLSDAPNGCHPHVPSLQDGSQMAV